MKKPMFGLLTALAVVLSSLCSGCVVIPIPVKEKEVTAGRRVEKKETAGWRVGETTRQEVLQQLGTPYADFQDLNVIAYDWTVVSAIMLWAIGGQGGATGGVEKLKQEHLLLVGFDEADRVAKFDILHHNFGSLRAQAQRWTVSAISHGARIGSQNQSRVGSEDSALLYVYRTGSWSEFIIGFPVRILLDDQLVAELKRHSYSQITVAAGRHQITGNVGPLFAEAIASTDFTARTNEPIYFLEAKVTSGMGKTTLRFTFVPPEEGRKAIRKLKYVDTSLAGEPLKDLEHINSHNTRE
jgi:outer membrane protein assembly factor BamE (lipoprotein component of BamABCDE complex)